MTQFLRRTPRTMKTVLSLLLNVQSYFTHRCLIAPRPTSLVAGKRIRGIYSPLYFWLTTLLLYFLFLLFFVRASNAQPKQNETGTPNLDMQPETDSDETIVVKAKAAIESPNSTRIDLHSKSGETTSVAETLSKEAGINVRSLGGLGGFSSISIRGAAAAHTAVFVDGVPLSKLGFGAQDLGTYSLGNFAALDVYRGVAPIQFGMSTIGGALDLRTFSDVTATANQSTTTLSLGAGSFGAKHVRGNYRIVGEKLSLAFGLGYQAAKGDYSYFNDQGTNLVLEDDRFDLRLNNGFTHISGVNRIKLKLDTYSFEVGLRGNHKTQGIPGPGAAQSERAQLSTNNYILDLFFRHHHPSSGRKLGVGAFLFLDDQTYTDLKDEIGIGQQSNVYQTISAGISGQYRENWGEHHSIAARAELGIEHFRIENKIHPEKPSPRTRRSNIALALRDAILIGETFVMSPVLRLDFQYTDPGKNWNPVVLNPDNAHARSENFISPRLEAELPVGAFVLKTSIGRFFRTPTANELYGDRGFFVGNPNLQTETGESMDLGFLGTLKNIGMIQYIRLQSALFASRLKETIVVVPSSGKSATSINLGDAFIYGTEMALHTRFAHRVEFFLNYTLLLSKQVNTLISFQDKSLPSRPTHQAFGRLLLHLKPWQIPLSIWGDLSYTSGNFLDAANQSEVPKRIFWGIGFKSHLLKNIQVGAEIKNLTNNRVETIHLTPPPRPDLARVPRSVSDFLGYPLPGRAFYLTLDSSF